MVLFNTPGVSATSTAVPVVDSTVVASLVVPTTVVEAAAILKDGLDTVPATVSAPVAVIVST